MKSITIHDLGDELDHLIREKARKDQVSINKTVKRLLEQALGITGEENQKRKETFADLHGVWSEEDLAVFEKATTDFESIDEEDWK